MDTMHNQLATVHALWSSFEARHWSAARRLFIDDATLTWHTSGERMLNADALIRVNAIYPEGWNIRVVEVNALQDGRVHSIVEVKQPPNRFIANSLFRFEQHLIAQIDEYWSTVEAPPDWRNTAAIGAYERLNIGAELVTIRPLGSDDSMQALTQLLHRAYAPLAGAGMNFTAVDQTVEVTARRSLAGQCFIAAEGDTIVGTVTVSGPFDPKLAPWALQTPWYYRVDTAHFHQFAVEPDRQGRGVGRQLVARCEQWAREQGYAYMALDTAVPAQHLRARYARLGFRDEGEVQWEGKTYRSAIMVKSLL